MFLRTIDLYRNEQILCEGKAKQSSDQSQEILEPIRKQFEELRNKGLVFLMDF
jgi:hypothetical protein